MYIKTSPPALGVASFRAFPKKSALSQTGPTTSNTSSTAPGRGGAVSSMCWYASYSDGRIRLLMLPSTTTNRLSPLRFVPVTSQTSAPAVATIDRPGSITSVSPRSETCSRTVEISSAGVGSGAPLRV